MLIDSLIALILIFGIFGRNVNRIFLLNLYSKMPSILSTIVKIGILLAILAILGVSIAILIKVNKSDKIDDNNNQLTSTSTLKSTLSSTSTTTNNYFTTTKYSANFDCMKKSTLPQATDNSTFNPVSYFQLKLKD